jgi:hypothetical protein
MELLSEDDLNLKDMTPEEFGLFQSHRRRSLPSRLPKRSRRGGKKALWIKMDLECTL